MSHFVVPEKCISSVSGAGVCCFWKRSIIPGGPYPCGEPDVPPCLPGFWGTAINGVGVRALLPWPRLTADQRGIVGDAAAWHCAQTASDVLGTVSSHLPLQPPLDFIPLFDPNIGYLLDPVWKGTLQSRIFHKLFWFCLIYFPPPPRLCK